jgi:hypothetical protein
MIMKLKIRDQGPEKLEVTDVSDEHVASILGVEEQAKQETVMSHSVRNVGAMHYMALYLRR